MSKKIEYYRRETDSIGLMLKDKVDTKRSTELTDVDKVSVRLFERLFGNYAGALELYYKKLYVQVGILTRSIFEDYLNILYLQRTPEEERAKLARRYLDYASLVEPYMLYENTKDLAEKLGDSSLVDEVYNNEIIIKDIKENKETFTNKYNNSIKSWSGLDFASIALKADEKDKYFRYYRLLSNVTHGSPLGNFTEDKITITIFISMTSFVALADLIGENSLAAQADEIKEELLKETDVF
ncbi:DUF5677 domain-containing protein [Guptibacillus hwajinpoensis]|uniref:MAE-28990/MAE-18760-like HEPN domain-containing protein n=1 Tax=Guptibacillus hwajinpoensis TaxID=208199 RepID=A0ABU0K183_9BACL|nr:DUF5677 domain-containing protein [Alkalihalobacillus hemicentroti]MDQ0482455.1 hypothetical protein [Alkalihalobacillus hemicentroti]